MDLMKIYRVMFSELNVENKVSEIENAKRQLKLGRSGGPELFINQFLYRGKGGGGRWTGGGGRGV